MKSFFSNIYSIIKRNLLIQNFLFLFFCLKKNQIKQVKNNHIVLVEFNQFPGCLISYFYFMNSLFKIEKVNFYLIDINIKKKINDFFFYIFFYLIGIKKEVNFKKIKKKDHLDHFQKLKNKIDIINFCKNDINIGIDIYEGFLKTYNKPTVDLKDSNFQNFFFEYLEYFEDMVDFVEKNKKNLKALIIFQTLYKNNMLCKLAYKNNIPVYLPDIEKFHMNANPFDEVKKFQNYNRESLNLLNKKEKIDQVEQIFLNRTKGIQSDELSYSTALLDNSQQKYQKVFDEDKTTRVLVCSHCFYDNPHPYQKSSFPDYFEWLSFIAEISKKTNYSWRIKVHDDCLPGTIETITSIIEKTKSNIQLLPKDITHTEIINNNVTHVLTCHGTVGYEYPYFNIPVINFNYNSRISFDFNIHSQNNIDKYKNILTSLHEQEKIQFNIKDMFTAYYMHYFNNTSNLFIDDFHKVYKKSIEDNQDYFFKEFLNSWKPEKEKNINFQIETFIKSKKNYFCWSS